MDGKKIGSIVIVVIGFCLVFWWKMKARTDDSDEVRQVSLAALSTMDDFEKHKSVVLPMAEIAHNEAFDSSYRNGRRYRPAEFDEDKYVQRFMDSMIVQARNLGDQEILKKLIKLRDEPADSPSAAGLLGEVSEVSAVQAGETAPSAMPSLAVADAAVNSSESPAETSASADPDGEEPKKSTRKSLTTELIAGTPDDKIEELIFDVLVNRVFIDDMKDEKEKLKKLSPGLQMVYTTWIADGEINNGGFDQFFANSSGRLAVETVKGFTLIDAKAHAKLLRRAIAAFVRREPDQKRIKVGKTVQGYLDKYDDSDMEALDNSYFKLKEDASKLRVKYIREHPDEFTLE